MIWVDESWAADLFDLDRHVPKLILANSRFHCRKIYRTIREKIEF